MLIVIVLGLYFTVPMLPQVKSSYDGMANAELVLKNTTQRLEEVKMKAVRSVEKVFEGGKRIYVAEDMEFSPEASFAPLFEDMINVAKASGIRFRSIKYNYSPSEDIIYAARINGYNVCELDIVAAGSYVQFQNFFKGFLKEDYLNSIAEVDMYPYSDNRAILIANLKLRLYTRTSGNEAQASEVVQDNE